MASERNILKTQAGFRQFFNSISGKIYRSEVAENYRKRLLKYQDKLFTFLSHDGVPWRTIMPNMLLNNLPTTQRYADGQFLESGLKPYLVLLSLYQTCRYKGVDFLKFCLTGEGYRHVL